MSSDTIETNRTCPKCKEEKPCDPKHFKYKTVKGIRKPTYCRECWNAFMKGKPMTAEQRAKYKKPTKGLYTRDPITNKTNLTEEHKRKVRRANEKRKIGKRIAIAQSLIRETMKNGCVDCGEKDLVVLEFDHRDPKQKSFNISEGIGSKSTSILQIEIAKCDVVCANCHRRRTAKMFGSWRER